MPRQPKAVVLLSGGLDSTTALAIAGRDGFCVHAMTFRYGQKHDQEVTRARTIASAASVADHLVVDLDARLFAGSSLTSTDSPVPKDRSEDCMTSQIPSTYVPARNTVFLAHGLACAEVLDARAIYIGVNALDYSGYPDCRPQYIAAFQALANLATKTSVEGADPIKVCAPLVHLTKAQIIREGLGLGVDYGLTSSCYDPRPTGEACGHCDACQLRLKGFAECGLSDPVSYAGQPN